ncbi:hypothetical protein WJX84_005093 [Apatococcus fuscideae]|uniref:Serine aminopeptidase S33 domain-containing protein n=1 Tax=Apatococcus fuscideae TaxID=2026836 RepID=A0AAW1T5S7_9CHLO
MSAETKVHFTNADQQQLVGLLQEAGSKEVCILCHGFADTKEGGFLPGLAAALAAEGQSSLRFDFSGNGESEGEFVYAGYWKEAEDLRAAVQWLKQQGRPTVGIAGTGSD